MGSEDVSSFIPGGPPNNGLEAFPWKIETLGSHFIFIMASKTGKEASLEMAECNKLSP